MRKKAMHCLLHNCHTEHSWSWQIITLLLFAKFMIFSPKERSIDQFNNIGNPESKLRQLVPDANDRTQFRFKETKKFRYNTILYPCNIFFKLYRIIHPTL